MKCKLILIMAFVLLCANTAFSSEQRRISAVESATDESVFMVSGTGTVYTKALWFKSAQNDEDIGVMYRATSPGAVDVNLTLEQSYTFPSTEGVIDSNFLFTNTLDSEIVDEVWHLATIDTVVMPVVRFVVSGEGSNHTHTTFEIKVGKH